MATYKLSNHADKDFESIYIYGVQTFGLDQAEAYAADLETRFEQLANHPLLYPAIDHVQPGYRLSVYSSHAIYYRINNDGVLTVRILRSQNVDTALSQAENL